MEPGGVSSFGTYESGSSSNPNSHAHHNCKPNSKP